MKTRFNVGQASRLSHSSNPLLERKTIFQVRRVSPLRAAQPMPRRARSEAPYLLCIGLLLAIPPLRAQVVNDGATNTLSNVTNTFTGGITVGTNGSFTLLVLSDSTTPIQISQW